MRLLSFVSAEFERLGEMMLRAAFLAEMGW